MKYTIDAQGKKLGRVASEAARLLRGKAVASFSRNAVPDSSVEIHHAGGLDLRERKLTEMRYTRYSGYPGGLKEFTLREFVGKRGAAELLRRVILGMLPRNRQRSRLIKRLIVHN